QGRSAGCLAPGALPSCPTTISDAPARRMVRLLLQYRHLCPVLASVFDREGSDIGLLSGAEHILLGGHKEDTEFPTSGTQSNSCDFGGQLAMEVHAHGETGNGRDKRARQGEAKRSKKQS